MNLLSLVKKNKGIVFICLLFFIAGMLRLNDLSFYTPDSSRYLIWGNSLAHGKGFVDETLPDPDPYVVHAPLYSLLIAPVEFLAPYSPVLVKAWTLLWGVLAVLLLYAWLCRAVGKTGALVGAILFAGNPLFWLYATEVLSDAPFIAAVLGVLYLCERMCVTEERKLSEQIFLLVAVLFASMVREVGAVVAVAAVVFLFLHKRFKEPVIMILVTGILIALWYVRNNVYASTASLYAGGNVSLVFRKLMTGSNSSLINEFALRIWLTFRSYTSQIPGLIFYPMFQGHFGHLFYIPSSLSTGLENMIASISGFFEPVIDILILIGLIRDFTSGKKMLMRGFFVLFYGGVILLYPINDVRFLVPLIPILILYLMQGANWLSKKFSGLAMIRQVKYAVLIAIVVMLPNFASAFEMVKANIVFYSHPEIYYSAGDESALYTSLYARPWTTLGNWIQQHLDEHAIIVSPYKQLATVVGVRKVTILDKGITLPQFEQEIRNNGVEYLVAPRRWGTINVYEALMMESKRFQFEEIYTIGDLHFFQVHSKLREPLAADNQSHTIDTSNTASANLRNGWRQLSAGKYNSANGYFLKAMSLAPSQPEIVYYTLVSYSLLDDSVHAREYYQHLYAAPQAGSYLDPASSYLSAMNQINSARELHYSDGIAVQSYKAASVYWKLGAYHKAAELMNYSLDADTEYFVGLLWGLHFNLQLGDTGTAKKYLAILDNIDVKNPIVQTFHQIFLFADSIGNSNEHKDRSRLYLAIANLYRKTELFDEAIDEAELSLCENPNNAGALLLIAQIHEQHSRYPVAEKMYRQILSFDPNNHVALAQIDSLQRKMGHIGL